MSDDAHWVASPLHPDWQGLFRRFVSKPGPNFGDVLRFDVLESYAAEVARMTQRRA